MTNIEILKKFELTPAEFLYTQLNGIRPYHAREFLAQNVMDPDGFEERVLDVMRHELPDYVYRLIDAMYWQAEPVNRLGKHLGVSDTVVQEAIRIGTELLSTPQCLYAMDKNSEKYQLALVVQLRTQYKRATAEKPLREELMSMELQDLENIYGKDLPEVIMHYANVSDFIQRLTVKDLLRVRHTPNAPTHSWILKQLDTFQKGWSTLLTDGDSIIKKEERLKWVRENWPEEATVRPDDWITVLGLDSWSYNAFKRAGITTVGEIYCKTADDLNRIYHFGRKSYERTVAALKSFGCPPLT